MLLRILLVVRSVSPACVMAKANKSVAAAAARAGVVMIASTNKLERLKA